MFPIFYYGVGGYVWKEDRQSKSSVIRELHHRRDSRLYKIILAQIPLQMTCKPRFVITLTQIHLAQILQQDIINII